MACKHSLSKINKGVIVKLLHCGTYKHTQIV